MNEEPGRRKRYGSKNRIPHEPDGSVRHPQGQRKGAFYIFINCKALGMKSAELADYLLENAKIALVPGDVFGPGGEGYLRMSFANSYENIVEGCKRLGEAVALLR